MDDITEEEYVEGVELGAAIAKLFVGRSLMAAVFSMALVFTQMIRTYRPDQADELLYTFAVAVKTLLKGDG